MSKKEFTETIGLLNKKVIKECIVVESSGVPLLHISTFKQKGLVPHVSKRAAPSEDNTIPKIYTSDSLLGCFAGYVKYFIESVHGPEFSPKKDNKQPYLGGYYIHYMPFDYALKPNTKVVFDQEKSNEHWLITYNKDTMFYKVPVHDKVYLESINITADVKAKSTIDIYSYIVSIDGTYPLQIDQKTKLLKGYYRLKIQRINDELKLIAYDEISKDIFEEGLKNKTAMLSHELKPFSVLDTVRNVKNGDSRFTEHGGLGFCGIGASLLKKEFERIGVDSKILFGVGLKPNATRERANLEYFIEDKLLSFKLEPKLVKAFKDLTGDNVAHSVILIGDDVYDIAGQQFGLPIKYSLSKFMNTWQKVSEGELKDISEADPVTNFLGAASSKPFFVKS